MNIIKQWDEKIFPDSNSSLVNGKKGESCGSNKVAVDTEEESEEISRQTLGCHWHRYVGAMKYHIFGILLVV